MFNIFSIVLVLIYFVILVKAILLKKNKFAIFVDLFIVNIILELFVGAGYFIKIGTFELLYSEFSLLVLFFWSIFLLFYKKFNSNEIKWLVALIGSIIISIILPVIFNYRVNIVQFDEHWETLVYGDLQLTPIKFSTHSLLLLLRVVIFCIIFSSGKNKLFNENNIRKILKAISKFITFYILIFIIEFGLKYIINPNLYSNLINSFFGIGAGTYTAPIYRGGLCCMQGLFKEPSHLALGMFMASLVLMANYNYEKKKRRLFKIVMVNAYSLLTISMSAILFVTVFAILYFRFGKHKLKLRTLLYLMIFVICSCLIILKIPYFRTRIDSVWYVIDLIINDTLDKSLFAITSGEVPRIVSIIYNLKWFVMYPIFGIGLGNTYAHSTIASVLCSIGIVGVFTWIKYLKQIKNVGKIDLLTGVCMVGILTLQGLMGYFYTVGIIYVFMLYFLKSNEKRDRYGWNRYNQL